MADSQTLESSEQGTNSTEDHPMPDAENPQTPSASDSGSESDSDSENEAQAKSELQNLELELSNNPSNYDAHVQYIRALRKQGELDKLRKAREAMSELFPLSPDMWREWAKDEISVSSRTDACSATEKLYERGISDYLSVALWCDYLNFVQEHDQSIRECSPAGITKARNLFEQAVTAAGLHVTEGNQIWQAYREFEQIIFHTINETDDESREKQVQRIRNIFHRQLSVPLKDLRSTLLTYKTWEVKQGNSLDVNNDELDGISSHVASAYQKALEMFNARANHEEFIFKEDLSESERFQNFMNYLQFEQSSGDPARVQILFERAITEFPIYSDLWLNYTHFLDKTLKVSYMVRDIYHRATRNCPWVGELWIRYLLALERGHAPEDDISNIFERAMQCTFSNFEEYLDIFLTRVDGLRRRMSLTGKAEDLLDYAVIKDTFQRASDYLSPHLKNTDKLLQMHSYWARLELNLGKDLIAARGVWESLLKISGSMLEAWQGYITMEIQMGHVNEARSLYKRCYCKRFPGTGSEDIIHLWLRFEREYGLLEDFDYAVQKVTPRLEELKLFRLHQESKTVGPSIDLKENSLRKNMREKRKQVSNPTDEQSPSKRLKDVASNKRVHGKQKAHAKKSAGASGVEEVEIHDKRPDNANERKTKDFVTGKPKQYDDQCTVFISNLGPEATYEDLHRFFSDVGGVVGIRILTEKFTKRSRGLAYVDFCDDAHLTAAVAKNKKKLRGRSLNIARSDPNQSKKREAPGDGKPREHGHGDEKDEREPVESSRASKPPGVLPISDRRRDDSVQLKGKNTFAVPRTVRPLGWTSKNKPKTESEELQDEKPKSNDEFRKMFLKT